MASFAPRVALVCGFWGTNIGNAFFNLGGKLILDQIFGAGRVAFIQDQPGYMTFNNQARGNPQHDLNLLCYLDVDYIVLQGPVLTETVLALWGDTLTRLARRGTKLVLLSAAFFRYTVKERSVTRDFLNRFSPALISTRDTRTYEIIKDWAEFTHDGIDSGFFVSDAYTPFRLMLEPYVAVNFDRYPEPAFEMVPQTHDPSPGCGSFEYLGQRWSYRSPPLQDWLSRKGKWQAYLGTLLDLRRLPDRLGRYVVVWRSTGSIHTLAGRSISSRTL